MPQRSPHDDRMAGLYAAPPHRNLPLQPGRYGADDLSLDTVRRTLMQRRGKLLLTLA
jgi:hypothetical protein